MKRDIAKLNEMFLEFGRAPDGGPKIQWRDTTEEFFLQSGGLAETVSEAGVIAMRRVNIRVPYAEMIGVGWCPFEWAPCPMTEWDWIQAFGDAEPFPRGGMWHPHEDVVLPPGVLPTRRHTEAVVDALRATRAMTKKDKLDAIKSAIKYREEAQEKRLSDEIDDMVPAFDNFQSGKRGGSVSFGGVAAEVQPG